MFNKKENVDWWKHFEQIDHWSKREFIIECSGQVCVTMLLFKQKSQCSNNKYVETISQTLFKTQIKMKSIKSSEKQSWIC